MRVLGESSSRSFPPPRKNDSQKAVVPIATAQTVAKPGTTLVEQTRSPLANDLLSRPLDHTKDMPQDGVGSFLLNDQLSIPGCEIPTRRKTYSAVEPKFSRSFSMSQT